MSHGYYGSAQTYSYDPAKDQELSPRGEAVQVTDVAQEVAAVPVTLGKAHLQQVLDGLVMLVTDETRVPIGWARGKVAARLGVDSIEPGTWRSAALMAQNQRLIVKDAEGAAYLPAMLADLAVRAVSESHDSQPVNAPRQVAVPVGQQVIFPTVTVNPDGTTTIEYAGSTLYVDPRGKTLEVTVPAGWQVIIKYAAPVVLALFIVWLLIV